MKRDQAYWDAQISLARSIAEDAHRGQIDKAGCDYITHPIAVSELVSTNVDKTAALLHDVVEDSPKYPIERLRAMGIDEEVLHIVEVMTHPDGEPYMDYIKRVKAYPDAVPVKIADMIHNMDINRIPHPTQRDFDRLEKKYKPAWDYLTDGMPYPENSVWRGSDDDD